MTRLFGATGVVALILMVLAAPTASANPACGAVVTTSIKLDNSMNCGTPALILAGNGITLNLAHNGIFENLGGTGPLVRITGKGVEIRNGQLDGGGKGVEVQNKNAKLSDLEIDNPDHYGIHVQAGASDAQISRVTIDDGSDTAGIEINADGARVSGSWVWGTTGIGIRLDGTSDARLSDNTVSGTSSDGISVDAAQDSVISGNRSCGSRFANGIRVGDGATSNLIEDNDLCGNVSGLRGGGDAAHTRVIGNRMNSNRREGAYITDGTGWKLTGNRANHNQSGFGIEGDPEVTLTNNVANFNAIAGFYVGSDRAVDGGGNQAHGNQGYQCGGIACGS
jgi:parallel beta-helix repeat protein